MSRGGTFLDAVQAGDMGRAERLLAERPGRARERDAQGVSAVLHAVYAGHEDLAQKLAAAVGELDVFEAAALGRRQRLAQLLDADATLLDARGADGFRPLGLAAFFGRVDAVQELLARGADANAASDNPMQVAPLHSAVAHRGAAASLQMTRLLLQHGAGANRRQAGGFTPLHQAAAHGRREQAELLLAHGADVSVRAADGSTPADLARERGHAELAERLRPPRV